MINVVMIAAGVISTASLVALGVYAFLVSPARDSRFQEEHFSELLYASSNIKLKNWKNSTFLALAALGLLVCFGSGAYTMLFWMPSSWGHTVSGDYVSTRTSLAIFAGLYGAVFFIPAIYSVMHLKFKYKIEQIRSLALAEIIEASLNNRRLEDIKKKYQSRVDIMRENFDKNQTKSTRRNHIYTMSGQELMIILSITRTIDELIGRGERS